MYILYMGSGRIRHSFNWGWGGGGGGGKGGWVVQLHAFSI